MMICKSALCKQNVKVIFESKDAYKSDLHMKEFNQIEEGLDCIEFDFTNTSYLNYIFNESCYRNIYEFLQAKNYVM